jgi:hypothetical protein
MGLGGKCDLDLASVRVPTSGKLYPWHILEVKLDGLLQVVQSFLLGVSLARNACRGTIRNKYVAFFPRKHRESNAMFHFCSPQPEFLADFTCSQFNTIRELEE